MNGVSRLVEIENLAVAFPRSDGGWERVVDGVSFDVAGGELVAMVGASGSGKSLATLSLLGLVPPPGRVVAGRVHLAGEDVRAASAETLRSLRGRVAGLVQQEPSANFNPVRRIWTQVSEAAARHALVSGHRERRALAMQLLTEVGIDDPPAMADAYPFQLSGGQRQRAAVAAALAAEPRVLLADEPTSALDAVAQAELLGLFENLRCTRGVAVLLVTHDLRLAASAADRVVVLHAGETVEAGPCSEVMREPEHPYTRALLDGPAASGGASLRAGALTRNQCRFARDCQDVFATCRAMRPGVSVRPDGRRVRCFLAGDAVEPADV
jgi:ABC-type dipeptide/oligopeptide/nickel transport system ATPase component